MKIKKSTISLIVLALISIFLIILCFVQSSTAQPNKDEDEDTGWFDARDYYNRLDRSTDPNYDNEENNKDDEDNGWWDPRKEYYNYTQSDHSTDLGIDDSLFLIFIISFSIIIYIIWKVTHRTKERRYFSSEVKRQALKNQNYKCVICKRSTGLWDYDHKNGDRSNNKLSNCQALCPNCHAKKTRGLLKTKNSKLSLVKIFVIIVMIIIFFIILFPILIRNFSID